MDTFRVKINTKLQGIEFGIRQRQPYCCCIAEQGVMKSLRYYIVNLSEGASFPLGGFPAQMIP